MIHQTISEAVDEMNDSIKFPVGVQVQRLAEKLIDGRNEVGTVIEINGDRRRIQWKGSLNPRPGYNHEQPKKTWLSVKTLREEKGE